MLIFPKHHHKTNHDKLSLDKNVYRDAVLVALTATLPTITTFIHTGKQISFTY